MPQSWKYIFGPVPSRRLGYSLGVDVIPSKLCTLDCVYCEVGRTDKRGLARKEYVRAEGILAEVREAVAVYPNLDHITISGSGEPTLNSAIGTIIREIKSFSTVPVAVLTNGTLLTEAEVRIDLLDADVVSPSLDAVSQEVFERVDRPHPRLRVAEIIEGLKTFRREYQGQLWLEILFVRGMNDQDEEVRRLKQVVEEIRPDRIHLNTVVRPPAESFAEALPEERMREIQRILGDRCEVIGVFRGKHETIDRRADADAILSLLRRRGMTVEGICAALEMREEDVRRALEDLERFRLARSFDFDGQLFFQAVQPENSKR